VTPVTVAPWKSAVVRFAFVKFAFVKSAWANWALVAFTPVKFAPVMLLCAKFPCVMTAFEKFAFERLARFQTTWVKVLPEKSQFERSRFAVTCDRSVTLEQFGFGVADAVAVAVFVGVFVAVSVGVLVSVLVGVFVAVSVGVFVAVLVGVFVAVSVGVFVAVFVAVLVVVASGVLLGVGVNLRQALLIQDSFASQQVAPQVVVPSSQVQRLRRSEPVTQEPEQQAASSRQMTPPDEQVRASLERDQTIVPIGPPIPSESARTFPSPLIVSRRVRAAPTWRATASKLRSSIFSLPNLPRYFRL